MQTFAPSPKRERGEVAADVRINQIASKQSANPAACGVAPSACCETLANVVERLARLTKQVLSNAQPGLPWLPPSFDARRPVVDLALLAGEWVIDEVSCPRPFDLLKTYDRSGFC
jgi:hypothetical protein